MQPQQWWTDFINCVILGQIPKAYCRKKCGVQIDDPTHQRFCIHEQNECVILWKMKPFYYDLAYFQAYNLHEK